MNVQFTRFLEPCEAFHRAATLTEIIGFEYVELSAHLLVEARDDVLCHVTLRREQQNVMVYMRASMPVAES